MVCIPFATFEPFLITFRTGLNQPTFITSIEVIISAASVLTGLVDANFNVRSQLQFPRAMLIGQQVHNPLEVDLILEYVQADAGVDGTIYAQFAQSFDNFVIHAGSTVNSGTFGNVLLTKGAIASLAIVPLGRLDIASASTVRIGSGGYQVPFLKINQDAVPTTYTLGIGITSLRQAGSGDVDEGSFVFSKITSEVVSPSTDDISTIVQTMSPTTSSADASIESLALPFLQTGTG